MENPEEIPDAISRNIRGRMLEEISKGIPEEIIPGEMLDHNFIVMPDGILGEILEENQRMIIAGIL